MSITDESSASSRATGLFSSASAGLPRAAHEFGERATSLFAGVARMLPVLPECCRQASFPASVWQHVDQPVLLIYGGLDKEVPSALSAHTITDALRRGGNTSYAVRWFPHANHAMFLATQGGFAAGLRGWRTARFPPGYVNTMTDWVKAVSTGARPPAHGRRPRRSEPVIDVSDLPWHASAPIQLGMWMLFATVFTAPLAQRLLARVVSRLRTRSPGSTRAGVRRSELLAAITSAVDLAVLGAIVLVFAQFTSGNPSSSTWTALRALAVICAVLTLVLLITTSRAWRKPSWSHWARLRHVMVTAVATAFVPFLAQWHLLG